MHGEIAKSPPHPHDEHAEDARRVSGTGGMDDASFKESDYQMEIDC